MVESTQYYILTKFQSVTPIVYIFDNEHKLFDCVLDTLKNDEIIDSSTKCLKLDCQQTIDKCSKHIQKNINSFCQKCNIKIQTKYHFQLFNPLILSQKNEKQTIQETSDIQSSSGSEEGFDDQSSNQSELCVTNSELDSDAGQQYQSVISLMDDY